LISARTLIRASHSLQAGRLRSSRARYFEKVLFVLIFASKICLRLI
jgi:hypothetical protein